MSKQKSSARRSESNVSGGNAVSLFLIIFGFPHHMTTISFKG